MNKVHNLFYIPPENISHNKIIISGEEFHHLKNVLRKKIGDTISVTDGEGHRYKIRITNITRSQIDAEIIDKIPVKRGRGINLTLAFVPLKGLRNDIILEKGTELGVRRFFPFISHYSIIPTVTQSKLKRFKKIALSAMLQSQQYYTPEIIFHKDLNNLLNNFRNFDLVFVADKNGKSVILHGAESILYIVGPEGGFADSEIEMFKNNDVRLLSLGPNRLRSETAAVTGVVKILSVYGAL